MRIAILWAVALTVVFAAAWPVAAVEVDTTNIQVKRAIADTMTPEELQAYKERLAVNFAGKTALGAGLDSRTPGDACPGATYEISTLPYGPLADTTTVATDDYDLPAAVTPPTCTAAATCVGAPSGTGNIYTGTGTGPDRAFLLRTDVSCDLVITMTPTGGDDLGLIVYIPACSSSLTDCACIDDTGVAGVAESVTLSAVAGVDYYVVVDGYSTGATPPGPDGPYTLSVTSTGACALVPVTLQSLSAE